MSLRAIQWEIGVWHKENFPDITIVQQGLAVGEEVGELQRAILKKSLGMRGSKEEWGVEIEKELADVFIALCGVARLHGVELEKVVDERFRVVRSRDPRARRLPE